MMLPLALGHDAFETYRASYDDWRPAIVEVAAAHGIAADRIVPYLDGSNLVAAVGEDVVVKIFPAIHRHQWESERRVLPRFHGALPLPVPELVASGERDDGHTYVIVTRLAGQTLARRWADFTRDDRVAALRTIGETMAAAHALDVGDVASLPPAWSTFLPAQIARCRARHERIGSPSWVIDHVDAFVAAHLSALPLDARPSILTGEYTPENLLSDGDVSPRLSGMIDFGDAMVGPGVYDLLGPATFLAAGDPRALGAVVQAHGLLPWPLTPALQRALLALLLVHRYANLDFQIAIPAWRTRVGSLEALAALVFAI